MRRSSIHLIGIARGKNKQSEREVIFEEIITKKFVEWMKDINSQIQRAYQRAQVKNFSPICLILRLQITNGTIKILIATRKKDR